MRGARHRDIAAGSERLQRAPATSAPDDLLQAMQAPRHSGQAVWLEAAGRDVVAVLGPEAVDARLIWHDIQAVAGEAGEAQGADLRLIPPGELAPGLRALAVFGEDQVTIWRSSSPLLSTHLRNTAARRAIAARPAVAALRGRRLPLLLPVLVPWWRKAVVTGTLTAVTAGSVALLPPGGVPRFPAGAAPPFPPPAAAPRAASRHDAGAHHGPPAILAAARPAAAPTGHAAGRPAGRAPALPPSPAPSPRPTLTITPLPSPAVSVPVPVPVTVHVKAEVCVKVFLGVCVKQKLKVTA